MFHINCKQMPPLSQGQPIHSCLVNHCVNFSMHSYQRNPYLPNTQESLIPIATMDSPKNEYANPGSCVTQRQVQTGDKRKNDEDVLKKMVFSFQLLVADWLQGNLDHSILL